MKPTAFMGERHDLLSVEPTNPGANTPLTWSPATNRIVQVVSASFWLTTDSNVGDRLAQCFLQNNDGKDGHFSFASVVQPADNAWMYRFTVGVAPIDMSAINIVQAPLGCCYQLQEDEFFYIEVTNMKTGDILTDIVLRYFLWERA